MSTNAKQVVTIDPATRTIQVQHLTEEEMFDWVLKGKRDSRLIERYIHDGVFEMWIDEEGRLDFPDELWLIKHAPRFKGNSRFNLLAGRCAVMAAGYGEYPDHGPEFAKVGLTPERAVGCICRWIPPRMQAEAKRISEASLEPIVAFDDESMRKAKETIAEHEGWLSMLAVSCDPAYVMIEAQARFLEETAMRMAAMGELP